jgi:hypothetical protein
MNWNHIMTSRIALSARLRKALCGAILLGTSGGFFATDSTAEATTIVTDTIVSDAFTGTNGLALAGRAPDTANLPGGTYVSNNYFGQAAPAIDTAGGNPLPSASSSANNMTLLTINSAGGYTKPTMMRISADLQMGPTNPVGFVELGFSAVNPGNSNSFHAGVNNGFSGIRFRSDGALMLQTFTNPTLGAAEDTTVFATYDSGALGALSSTAFYNLKYDIDTTTGDISNITLSNGIGSVTYDLATTIFTGSNTSFLAIGSGSGTGGTIGHFDNLQLFELALVAPEPGSFALLGMGLVCLARRAQRNKRSRA